MLQERRQRHTKWFRQLSDSSGPAAQPFEYRPSGRVRQAVEHSIQLRGLLVSQLPKYTRDV